MDLVKLREELEIDEGVEYEIYKDHLGYPTFGVGHLILESDPEHGEEMGTPVSKERVIEAFESDVKIVVEDCKERVYASIEGKQPLSSGLTVLPSVSSALEMSLLEPYLPSASAAVMRTYGDLSSRAVRSVSRLCS